MMTLLDRIEIHLIKYRISATRFGRRAVGDPRFVLDLRAGRRPRRRTLERLNAYLGQFELRDLTGPTRVCCLPTRDGACQTVEQLRSKDEFRRFRHSLQGGRSVSQ